MNSSANLGLNYLQAAQAQKHLTVNNAVARLDGCAQWVVKAPKSQANTPKDGEIYLEENQSLSLFLNGGFENLTPKISWRAYFEYLGCECIFDGQNWQPCANSILKRDVYVVDLAVDNASAIIPDKSVLIGLTARVIEPLEGASVTSWILGIKYSPRKFGQGLWLGKNGWCAGPLGQPQTFWQDTPIVVSGEEGALSKGKVMIYVYYISMDLPPEV